MATKKTTTTKVTKKPAPKKVPLVKATKQDAQRKLQHPKYQSFRISRRIKSSAPKIPSAFVIFGDAFRLLRSRKKLFIGITIVYLLLALVLVKGLAFSGALGDTKQQIEPLVGSGVSGHLIVGAVLVGFLASGAGGTPSAGAGAYQVVLLMMISLAVIWALRQVQAGVRVTVKEAFYKSTYPLIPFLLVLMIIGVQLFPVVIANFVYGAAFAGGVAVTALEKMLWLILVFLLVLWSIYMLTASLFALYIVTLPDVKPIQAVRTAHELLLYRRWTVMRKLLFLPFVMTILGIGIMLPVALYLTPAAEYVFFVLTSASLIFVHAYMYTLYRKLI